MKQLYKETIDQLRNQVSALAELLRGSDLGRDGRTRLEYTNREDMIWYLRCLEHKAIMFRKALESERPQ